MRRKIAWPRGVLLCPPEHFDVIDVKNPYMEGQVGRVDRSLARRQWEALRAAFEGIGLEVHLIQPVPGCEDMVFTANQTFVGLDAEGRRTCVPSHMRHESRRREVPAFVDWFRARGYRIAAIEASLFEGGGDAIWHPGRALLWGGHGHRTTPEAYPALARVFGAEVETLELATEGFYHLDTCFCPLDAKTVLLFPGAFTPEGLRRIRRAFPRVVEVGEAEARDGMACNAAAFFGTHVVLQRGSRETNRRLVEMGYEVVEVETGEFLKSGGSVFCMKQFVY